VGLGTAHHLFLKRHLIDLHRTEGEDPLIVLQVDFEKAFDKVPRKFLWDRLEELGVRGEFLAAIKRAYEKVCMITSVKGRKSEPFMSLQGVKQGCPLSPELFGLFIEILSDWIRARDARGGTPDGTEYVLGMAVSLLLYADDATLLATTPERMFFLVRILDEFCLAFGMRVNIAKCELLVYAPSEEEAAPMREACKGLTLRGESIPMPESAKYLGLVFGPELPFVSCRTQLVDSGRAAMHALSANMDRLKLFSPDLRVRCFNTQVRSILSYGCEAWGPDVLEEAMQGGPVLRRRDYRNRAEGVFEACLKDPAVKLQTTFFRHTVGACRPAHRLLYAEMGAYPLHEFWARMVIGFWNRVAKQGGTVWHSAMMDELMTAWNQPQSQGWGAKFIRFLKWAGHEVWEGAPRHESPGNRAKWALERPLPMGLIMGNVREKFFAGWAHERMAGGPRDMPSDGLTPGVKMSQYLHWTGLLFKAKEAPVLPAHAKAFILIGVYKLYMRFRLGCWPLEANKPWETQVRAERLCTKCTMGAVEDEKHVLLECPAYTTAREKLQLDPGCDMKTCMARKDQRGLAEVLGEMWIVRFGIPY
jgi:Reverse transcriptase (RNA-dependent DNA polymerase)